MISSCQESDGTFWATGSEEANLTSNCVILEVCSSPLGFSDETPAPADTCFAAYERPGTGDSLTCALTSGPQEL